MWDIADTWVQFFYFALIGLVVVSLVLGSGLRWYKILLYGLIWCGVIVTLVAAYQYHYQLQDVDHQPTMESFPASPLSRYNENGLNVTLYRGVNGHFETQGLVNHQTLLSFMIDTGASSVVLSYEDATALGLDMQELIFAIPASTSNGTARFASIRLQSLKIGEIERNNIRALIAQPRALSDSLLGMNFLNSLSGYNVRADQMTLID